MKADKLKTGDTIGIVCPSHIADKVKYQKIISALEEKGFRVKTGRHLYDDTFGYLASDQERADDFNSMVKDRDVKLVFFGGGNGSTDILPLIDYEEIKRNPKLFLSYSDGTSILNGIYSRTGLTVCYGQAPGMFPDITDYDYEQFVSGLMKPETPEYVSSGKWHSLEKGVCEGILLGGYLVNFALSVNGPYLSYDENQNYILFLEDHEKFNSIAAVSGFLSHIEQSEFMSRVSGLLFGNYSDTVQPWLLDRLRRLGQKHHIPTAYCDDFGHGKNHAVLQVGRRAVLDTEKNTMRYTV